MDNYRYVVVSSDGRSWLLQGDKVFDSNTDQNCVLPQLLAEGWRPVRERSMGGQDGAFSLILLKQRDPTADEEIPF